ncbi:hypothetical protein QUW15_13055 [Desulfovibrio piger]|nr:hypothetical protein [Desulfovibrio piger]
MLSLEHFQFEMLRVAKHTACRFAKKAPFFPLSFGRAALCRRFTFCFSNGEMLLTGNGAAVRGSGKNLFYVFVVFCEAV